MEVETTTTYSLEKGERVCVTTHEASIGGLSIHLNLFAVHMDIAQAKHAVESLQEAIGRMELIAAERKGEPT